MRAISFCDTGVMMDSKDRVLGGAALLLKALVVLNIVVLVGFAAALLLSWPYQAVLTARLTHKYGASLDVMQAVAALRSLLALGVVSSLAVHPLLVSLVRIVATVGAGDPFVDENATRLVRIGWALLVLQLLDLCLGALGRWMTVLKLHWAGWTPLLGGWIAVAMVFVLARVFRIGARMRDDLAATV
jgi:uncharacterized protein (DUF697 family)